MADRQRGVSLSGMLVVVVILILIALGGLKVIPPYLEAKTIQNQLDEMVRDPGLKGATVNEIRQAYVRRASVGNITSIKPEDIEINKDSNGITLGVSYTVKIPLAGNASLLFEFSLSSPK